MSYKLPPRTDFRATQWGFTTRDFGIAIGGVLLGLLQIIVPYAGIFVRLVAFTLIVLTAMVLAFWRIEKVYTIEEFVLFRIRQWRGYRHVYLKDGAEFNRLGQYANPAEKATPTAPGRVLFMLPEWLVPKSNQDLVYSALSIVTFVAFISWVGTGGVEEAQRIVQNFGQRMW